MTSEDDNCSRTPEFRDLEIPKESYTALRLYHTTPEVIDRETRVLVIGPIPLDWAKHNKEIWTRKRFAKVRKLIPQPKKFLRQARSRRTRNDIEALNEDVMEELALSPTTTISSDAGDDSLPESQSDLPTHLLDRLEQQEEEEQHYDDDGSSLMTAPSSLDSDDPNLNHLTFNVHPPSDTSTSSLLSSGAGSSSGFGAAHAAPHADATVSLAPINIQNPSHIEDEQSVQRPGFLPAHSYGSTATSTANESFVTAEQSFHSTASNSRVPSINIEEASSDEDQEPVDGYEPNYDSDSSTIKRKNSAQNYLSAIMKRDDTQKKDRNLAKKTVRFPVNVVGNVLHVGGKGASYAYQAGARGAGLAVQAGSKGAGFAFGKAGNTLQAAGRHGARIKRRGTKMISAKKVLRRRKYGEVVRLERLLVTVKHTAQTYLPPDFNETESVSTRMVERWKEFIVVARNMGIKNGKPSIRLQFYTNRNITQVESQKTKPKSKLDIDLNSDDFHVNWYSSLDKTIALWKSSDRGTIIYIFQASSKTTSMNWLAFLAGVVGVKRAKSIQLKVPDLGVAVEIPFPMSKRRALMAQDAEPYVSYRSLLRHDTTPSRLVKFIFETAVSTLCQVDGLKQILERDWFDKVKFGLAWRRYDRLEWIFDIKEQQFQSAWAMIGAYDLELRPKSSYTRPVLFEDGAEMTEPTPVEGFVMRLSSWSGQEKHQKMFQRRLYIHSHDNLLFYARSSRAMPPRPTGEAAVNLSSDTNLEEIVESLPTIYEVKPFESENGHIKWMEESDDFEQHNSAALFEMQRRVALIQRSDGFIDLTELAAVRPIDDEDDEEDSNGDGDGGTLFELELEQNSVKLRLRAENRLARDQWVKSLSELMRYWKRRLREDVLRNNAVRSKNLKTLQIDDDMDAFVGEAVPKWETAGGIADPLSYTMSGVSWSRSVHFKGYLYQKTGKFSTFRLYYAVLCHGLLILYSPYDRDSSGNILPRISYEKHQTIELKDCYAFSGNITSSELMERDRWFDKNNPGKHSLPRVYSDGWKSAEEETMRCFVLWFGRKRVKASKDEETDHQNLKLVNRLGVSGISLVFVARSRQERDMWVTALGVEIGRIADNTYQDITLT